MLEQHPILPPEVAANFDDDNMAISRLLLRGLITESSARTARKKYVDKVAKAIRHALGEQAK